MSGNKYVFLSLIPDNGNEIEFGGGYMTQIAGKGLVKILGIPLLEDVYYVADLLQTYLALASFVMMLQMKFVSPKKVAE